MYMSLSNLFLQQSTSLARVNKFSFACKQAAGRTVISIENANLASSSHHLFDSSEARRKRLDCKTSNSFRRHYYNYCCWCCHIHCHPYFVQDTDQPTSHSA
mmetsp:Transcript_22162/g.46633  ORF Transcript_22162/g.46633 Transcript_22162/m.46633 type:complete len:101 (+) Transcript_22162:1327-1629(+)